MDNLVNMVTKKIIVKGPVCIYMTEDRLSPKKRFHHFITK